MHNESRSINSFVIHKKSEDKEVSFQLVNHNPHQEKKVQLSAIDLQTGQALPIIINGKSDNSHIFQPLETIEMKIATNNRPGRIKVSLSQTVNSGGFSMREKNINGESQTIIALH